MLDKINFISSAQTFSALPTLVLVFPFERDLMGADTCSVVREELLIFCLSCLESVFSSHSLAVLPLDFFEASVHLT